MNKKVKAKIIGLRGDNDLAVEWLTETVKEGSVNIGGPVITSLPLSLVPKNLRTPNSVVLVSLADRNTVTKVEGFE